MGTDPEENAAGATGGYSMGFAMHPLTADGELDSSLDFRGGMHKVDKDPLYKMACDNREQGNSLVKEGKYEQAVASYSELIVKTRTLEGEEDVLWDDAARDQVRLLRATAYLNLSLCFLKLEQWTHASNTATRAIQGDKDPPNPKENVLPADKKAKAYFRRATAQCEGFGNFDKALGDLRKARELAPEDKAIEQMFRKADIAVKKTAKAADKKMAGFLKKEANSGEGLFDESLRQYNTEGPQLPSEPVKVRDGLYLVPKDEGISEAAKHEEMIKAAEEQGIDYENLAREIHELKEDNPDLYKEMQEQVKKALEKQAEEVEAEAAAAQVAELTKASAEAVAAQ